MTAKVNGTAGKSGNQKLTAAQNRRLVLNLARLKGPLSQLELRGLTGLHHATISTIVNELVDQGLLVKCGKRRPSRRSPPEVLVGMNPAVGWFVGIGYESGQSHIVLLDACGQVIQSFHLAYSDDVGELIRTARGIVDGVRAGTQLTYGPLLGVGLASPGVIDPVTGKLLYREGHHKVINLKAELESAFSVPAYVENDTRAGAVATHLLGGGRDMQEFLFAELAFSLSAGEASALYMSFALCLDGRIRTGIPPTAGEANGSLRVFPVQGFTDEDVAVLSDADADVNGRLAQYAGGMVPHIASLLDFLGVDSVVLGSNVPCANRAFAEIMRKGLMSRLLPLPDRPLQVVWSGLGEDAVAIGAGMVAAEQTDFLALAR